MHNWNLENWNMPMMWLFTIPIIILVVWLIIWLNKTGNTSGEDRDTPVTILKKRYARGEISKKEFEEMIKQLHKEEE